MYTTLQVEVEKDMWVEWDRGGSMTMADIAQGLETQQLQALKKECGGLQTLLKNHRHMFSLQNGQVSLQVSQISFMAQKITHSNGGAV